MITKTEWAAKHGLIIQTYNHRLNNWVYDEEKEILSSPRFPETLFMKMSKFEYYYIAKNISQAQEKGSQFYYPSEPCQNNTMSIRRSNGNCTCSACKHEQRHTVIPKEIKKKNTPSEMATKPCKHGNISLLVGKHKTCTCPECWNEERRTSYDPKREYIAKCSLTGTFHPHLLSTRKCLCQKHRANRKYDYAKKRAREKGEARIRKEKNGRPFPHMSDAMKLVMGIRL